MGPPHTPSDVDPEQLEVYTAYTRANGEPARARGTPATSPARLGKTMVMLNQSAPIQIVVYDKK